MALNNISIIHYPIFLLFLQKGINNFNPLPHRSNQMYRIGLNRLQQIKKGSPDFLNLLPTSPHCLPSNILSLHNLSQLHLQYFLCHFPTLHIIILHPPHYKLPISLTLNYFLYPHKYHIEIYKYI